MKKLVIVLFGVIGILAVFFLVRKEDKNMDMSFSQMEEKIESNVDYLVIDVRTKEEYETGKILDAINIPLDEIEKIKEIEKDKNKYLFVYCRSGNRSNVATQKLRKMGYKNAYNVGGIIYYKK